MRTTITLSFLLIFSCAFAQDDWGLKKDKEDIKVYTRAVEGSSMKAIKATTEFAAPLECCIAVLRDIPHLTELFPDCPKAEKVSQSETDQIHYLLLKAPWPVSDRDATFHLAYSYDPSNETATVVASTVVEKYPVQKGVVRLTKGGGTWEFKRNDENRTSLIYHFHGESGGSIPAWLANSVVEENPFKMLQNFHSLIKLERYQGKGFGFIK